MTPDEFMKAKMKAKQAIPTRRCLRPLSTARRRGGVQVGCGIAGHVSGSMVPVGRLRPQRTDASRMTTRLTLESRLGTVEKHHRLPSPNIDRPMSVFSS